MNPYRTNDLWCKKCLWHKCRCAPYKTEQYTRTMEMVEVKTGMTMDDLRRNALESVIEELKERD